MRSGEQPPLLSKHLVATACTLRLDTNSSWAGPQDVNIATDVIPAVIFESPLILHVHIYINIHIQTHKCTYTIYIYTLYIYTLYIYTLYIYTILYIYYIYTTIYIIQIYGCPKSISHWYSIIFQALWSPWTSWSASIVVATSTSRPWRGEGWPWPW